MDGAKFAKMLSDKHLFELDRMEYKYSVSSVQEFTELLRQNFAQPLPLADFSSDELFYLPNLAQISTNGMKQLLSAPASNQTFGLQAMTEEIHATFQIESIHSSRNSIRHILNGYAPRNEEESRIYGMKRGLDFIADRQNTITEENLHQLYQISTGDYLPDEDRLLPDHFYRHDVVYVVGGEESREGLPAQQLPDAMKRLISPTLKMASTNCIKPLSCILLSPTIIPILMAMAARLGCSTFGILSSRAILRHCSRRFPAILLRARQPTTKPMTVSKRTHSSLATRT